MNSIREVAKQAGVSTATVSRAFNTPELISQPTRQRVLEAAERLDYRPLRGRSRKPAARLAAPPPAGETFLGFQFFGVSPDDLVSANAFYAPVLAGAQAEAASQGLHLLTHTTDRRQFAQALPRMVQERTIAGMLLVGTAEPTVLATFLECVPQIVLVDNRDPTYRHDCILADNLNGLLTATHYLFGLGHRRIGFLMAGPFASTFHERLRGFACAHFEAGIELDPRLILKLGAEDDIPDAVRSVLHAPDRPTALIAANDKQAFAVLQTCRTLGLNIPEDLSVIGFDDVEFSAQTWPPLTTVRVPKEHLGRLAVRQLQARLQAERSPVPALPPVTIEVPVSLIERQSCRILVP